MEKNEITVPFLDLQQIHDGIADELNHAVAKVIRSGAYILGEFVEEFEAKFARYQHSRHCIGVGNGLDAISLSLRALGIGPGDDVLVPSNTFIATWLAVTHAGANPIAVEPDPTTHLIDAEKLQEAITPRSKAVIVVHLYGQMPDMARISEFCRKRGLVLIEDSAQAHGAEYRGQRAGAWGQAAAFSFYPGKNLGAIGDAGAVVTNDDATANKIRQLRNYGSEQKYVHECLGFNSRLDPLQAAILTCKLEYLDQWNARRREIANLYFSLLQDVPSLVLPRIVTGSAHVWHLFVVQHKSRDAVRKILADKGIQTLIHYPIPPHKQNAYAMNQFPALPVAERLATEVLSLPMGPHLTDQQVSLAAERLIAACKQQPALATSAATPL